MAFSRQRTAPAAAAASTVSCPFGKASVCFPLSITRAAAVGALIDMEGASFMNTSVVGYTTRKSFEAGAFAIRVKVNRGADQIEAGALAVAVRAQGQDGFLVGIAAARCGGSDQSEEVGLEIVIFGRPDKNWEELMYLPEDVLKQLLPENTSADVRVLKSLAPVQHDCPPQWLRDRFLRLVDMVNETYEGAGAGSTNFDLQGAVEEAGIMAASTRQMTDVVGPADSGKRVGQEEMGYWEEEMAVGIRCGGIEGGARLDGPDAHGSFPGIEAMC